VIALGNNDVNQAWPLDQSVAALRDLIGRFPDAACIQVVNVNARTARADFNDRARILDAALATEVAGHPGVHLVDWAGHIEDPARAQASRTWFTDGVHLTEAGINEYATVIADGLSACPDH
jgi:hypothetical protein